MPEPVLAISLIAGYTALVPLVRRGTALSQEAEAVQSDFTSIADHVERSVALFGAKSEALNQLRLLADECGEADWDGYGALAVNEIAVGRATALIRSLPEQIPQPDCSVEPDGSISLDWNSTRLSSFSVSVGESDRLAYAWVDGTDRGHAVARSFADRLPNRILDELKRILSHGAALRVA